MTTPPRLRAQLKEAVLAHADELAAGQLPRPVSSRRRRSRTPLLPATTAALAAAAAAVVILATQSSQPPQASAATLLYASAAALQHSGSGLQLGPHSYLYARTIERSRFIDPSGTVVLHALDESWTARNGAGRVHQTVLDRSALRHLDLRLSPPSQPLRPSNHPYTLAYPVALSYRQLQRLPSAPRRLAAVVDRLADRTARAAGESSSRGVHSETVLYILHSIAVAPAPAAVRGAVYRVMASTPGIRLVGHRRDTLGRRGEMFAATLGPMRVEMLINPTTGRLLQFTRALLQRSALYPGWRPGLISQDTYARSTVVPSITAS